MMTITVKVWVLESYIEERSNFGFLDFEKPGIKRSKTTQYYNMGLVFGRLIAGAFGYWFNLVQPNQL